MSIPSTLQAEASLQQEIRRSRFLAQAAPVGDADEAAAFIARVSAPDASHNVWAFRTGAQYRFNDDGEPGGSGGRPVLAAIDGQGLDRVAVVVTRWFGGIKLGVGGLMRAYGGCAAECLRRAPREPLVERFPATVHCEHALAPLVFARLADFDALRRGERTGLDGIAIDVDLPAARREAFATFVRDVTRGRGRLDPPT